jgi:acyl carrier protein
VSLPDVSSTEFQAFLSIVVGTGKFAGAVSLQDSLAEDLQLDSIDLFELVCAIEDAQIGTSPPEIRYAFPVVNSVKDLFAYYMEISGR